MPPTDDLSAPLYHAAGRITFVGRPRPVVVLSSGIIALERCGIGGCERRATLVADAILDEEKPGEVHICRYHAQPLLEA